jgi:hypothetical protein
MVGPAGYGTGNFVSDTTLLPYQIVFENEPTATAPAQRVDITDQLNASLDWRTFQLAAVGFGSTYIAVPSDLQHYDTTVNVTENGQTFEVVIDLNLDPANGVFTASLQSIDPTTDLPPASVLTGFLPPEDGTGRGIGYVGFTVSPKGGLSTGMQIRNVADISFDFAPNIATDQVDDQDPTKGIDPNKQALVTIDATVPTSSVNPLPAMSSPRFTLSWSGSDGSGSGIASYDIDVSDNGGPFTPFLTGTTQTSATFTGLVGHTYAFYSVATSNVGLVQPAPMAAQATTSVIQPVVTPSPTPTTPTSTAPVTVTSVREVTNKKHQATEVIVTFSGALNAAEADNPAIYRLTLPGKKGSYTAKNAKTIKLKSAVYDPAHDTVTLIPTKPFPLKKPVQLVIDGLPPSGLQDSLDRYLDGARTGRPGGNAVAILSRGGATIETVAAGSTGGQTGGIMAIVDALFEQDAFAGLAMAQRPRRGRPSARW